MNTALDPIEVVSSSLVRLRLEVCAADDAAAVRLLGQLHNMMDVYRGEKGEIVLKPSYTVSKEYGSLTCDLIVEDSSPRKARHGGKARTPMKGSEPER